MNQNEIALKEETSIASLLNDSEVQYLLKDSPLIEELIGSGTLSDYLNSGEITLDLESVNDEIILCYQLLFQMRGVSKEDGEVTYTGFASKDMDIVRKVIKDIASLKKLGKELKEKRQVNKQVFDSVMTKLAASLEYSLDKVLQKRELTEAVLQEVWTSFVDPSIRQGLIEEGVSKPVLKATPETVSYTSEDS